MLLEERKRNQSSTRSTSVSCGCQLCVRHVAGIGIGAVLGPGALDSPAESSNGPHLQRDSHRQERGNRLRCKLSDEDLWATVLGLNPLTLSPMSMLVFSNDYWIKILINNHRLGKLEPRSLRDDCHDRGASHCCHRNWWQSMSEIGRQSLLTVPTCPVMWNSTLLAPEKEFDLEDAVKDPLKLW